MSHDDLEHQNEEELTDEFESHLEAVVSEIYPTLCNRIARSGFAGWHRRLEKSEDLAQQAAFEFLSHFKKKRELPENPLRYLVVVARHIAQREYRGHQQRQGDFKKYAAEIKAKGEPTTEDAVEFNPDVESEEHVEIVRAAVDGLPRKQREAFQLRTEDPGATDKELGVKMGIGEDGFRKNVQRAHKTVLKRLSTTLGRKDLPRG